MSADGVPVLWHIKVSNFNEKARWALDYKRIPHRRCAPLPLGHALVALALTRRVATFPVLQLDGRAIGDSTRIIAALERRFPDPPLYPGEPAMRHRALELEEFFDENLGPHVRRVAFWELLRAPDLMLARVGEMTTPRQGRVIAAAFPAVRATMFRRYSINERSAGQSLLKVRAAMRLIEDVLDAGDHLVGGQFTVADLAAAALLAPLIGPPELPYRDPDMPLPPRLAEIAGELRSLPAGQWILRTYERHRPASAEIDPEPAFAENRRNGQAPGRGPLGARQSRAD
ncbi:MAG: glutathione S-transferase [Actinobacteria bacterium]|nr:MAG: glutathione S-transferase [Actinomycetota bacterium]